MEEMETATNIDGLEVVYAKPKNAYRHADHTIGPGCGHGVVHKDSDGKLLRK